MQRKIGIWLGVCLLVGFFLWPYQAVAQEEKPLVPSFSMSNRGEPVSFPTMLGGLLCSTSGRVVPTLPGGNARVQKLHEELEETGEAVLLMLNQIDGVRETVASGEKYLNDNGFTFLNLHDNGTVGDGF